jgi:hypothetical protein
VGVWWEETFRGWLCVSYRNILGAAVKSLLIPSQCASSCPLPGR